MKYYLLISTLSKSYLIAAKSEDEALKFASDSKISVSQISELTSETFNCSGFII